MNFVERYALIFRRLLPNPFTIAILLSAMAFLLVLFWGEGTAFSADKSRWQVTADIWYKGIWSAQGFSFAMQMMLMLLLGHVVALSKPVSGFLDLLCKGVKDTARAAVYVTFFTILVSLFNWGLGLVFGALFARKIGEKASSEGWSLNYGLIGACGYIGLMVWHGGISGSAPIKVADEGHLAELVKGKSFASELPAAIPLSETIFSPMNIVVTLALVLVLPLIAFWLGKKVQKTQVSIKRSSLQDLNSEVIEAVGMEKVDNSNWLGRGLGILVLFYALVRMWEVEHFWSLRFLTPDFINYIMLGLAFLFHGSISRMMGAVGEAIGGVSGILLQFPLYYGILSLMQDGGLLSMIAGTVSEISGEISLPLMNFASAGLMNIFVPSGGGQWVVQGPVIIETALNNGVSLPKGIMAMAYGDQLTNMLQPFWALPLLAITGLKAKEILPYTLIFMVVGILIFSSALIIF